MKWEYKIASIPYDDNDSWNGAAQAKLNELGNLGWELVSMDWDANAMTLKRRISGTPDTAD